MRGGMVGVSLCELRIDLVIRVSLVRVFRYSLAWESENVTRCHRALP